MQRLYNSKPVFNTPAAITKARLLPYKAAKCLFTVCANCSFVNFTFYRFCTNCGYPVSEHKSRLALYNRRIKQRSQLWEHAGRTIQLARNMLYAMAAVCFVAMFFVLPEGRQGTFGSVVLTVLALFFAALARWSSGKPLTSLLISFLVLLTFIAITTWAQFMNLFTKFNGLYMLSLQALCFVFLFRGVQAAFRADRMEDEFKK